MSGIVAIVNTDGAPCDAQRLRELTQRLAFRGPDGMGMEVSGEAGLGATLFRTTDESAAERQPLSLDGTVWIIADCRIDDRAALIAALRAAGANARASAPDVELILRAYRAWGTRCAERLLGDFSFAIWDGRDRTLFAARDQFGVKPFFYAQSGSLLIVSNTLGCIRQHPDVPSEVNEAAIGDFLLIGNSFHQSITAFRHIQRLPAAHTLRCRDGGLRVARYWQLPQYEEPLASRRGEIVEHFRDVLRTAVTDRLRVPTAGIHLSGGVDSTCVAATAVDLRNRTGADVSLTAWTFDARPLVPGDRECDLARLTASALGLPHFSYSFEGYTLFRDTARECVAPRPEPYDLSLAAADVDAANAIATSCRVLLTGQGGDGVFRIQPLSRQELLPFGWFTVACSAASYALRRREPPPLGVRSAMKQLAGIGPRSRPSLAEWIEPDFAKRAGLEDRWHELMAPVKAAPRNLVRRSATEQLRDSWASVLEPYDAESSRVPLDVRHPLLDLRLVDFLLQVPGIPWFWHKDLPRRACLGPVPSEVRKRRKVPLPGNPVRAALERGDTFPTNWRAHPFLARYVRCDRIPRLPDAVWGLDPFQQWSVTYPVSLSLWLQSLTRGHANEEHARARAVAW
jgi:asparagine synthase (glutamine-hydrolysing)